MLPATSQVRHVRPSFRRLDAAARHVHESLSPWHRCCGVCGSKERRTQWHLCVHVVATAGVCVGAESADVHGHALPTTAFKIYVTGGRDASAKRLQTCEVFDTARRRWSRLPSMKCVRSSGCASHTTDGRVLAIAGHNGRANLKSAEEYDPVTNKWTSVRAVVATTPHPRCRSPSAARSGMMCCTADV